MNIRSGNGKLGMRGRRPADRKALERSDGCEPPGPSPGGCTRPRWRAGWEYRGGALKGSRAHGWNTELWTLKRVADVIAMETGVRHRIGHV